MNGIRILLFLFSLSLFLFLYSWLLFFLSFSFFFYNTVLTSLVKNQLLGQHTREKKQSDRHLRSSLNRWTSSTEDESSHQPVWHSSLRTDAVKIPSRWLFKDDEWLHFRLANKHHFQAIHVLLLSLGDWPATIFSMFMSKHVKSSSYSSLRSTRKWGSEQSMPSEEQLSIIAQCLIRSNQKDRVRRSMFARQLDENYK